MKSNLLKSKLNFNLQIFLLALTILCGVGAAQAATYTVSNTNQSGTGSLTDAIVQANASAEADTITFDAGVFAAHQTINWNSGFVIPASGGKLTINGPEAGVTISLANSTVSSRRHFTLNDAAANLEISRLTLTGGSAFAGGAIYSRGTVTVIDSVITGNAAAQNGGGLDNFGGTMTVQNTIVSNNSAGGVGGGIINDFGSTMTVRDSTVSGNSSTGFGGGIGNYFGTMTIQKTTVSGNSTGNLGGGIGDFRGTITLTDSTVSGNSAGNVGGIATGQSTITLTNSTVSGNSSPIVGGIAISGTLNLTAVTVTSNRSTRTEGCSGCAGAGGIFITSNGTANLQNTIVAGNTAAYDAYSPDIFGVVSPTSSYNLIGNSLGMSGVINGTNGNQVGGTTPETQIDPRLAPLANNGGATQTHALLPGSIAVDAGNSFGLTTDQRGFVRPFDNPFVPNAPGGDGADIGAFESQLIGPPANKDQCKNGGWQLFNYPRTFRNQGDCIQFVNTGR